jgi:hypothetical protein
VVEVLDAGVGAAEVLRRPVRGRVVSVHRRAAYLRLDGELVALVAPGVDPGPLHVRCVALPVVRCGESVTGDDGVLRGSSGWAVRGSGPIWRGELPPVPGLVAHADDEVVRRAVAGVELAEEARGLGLGEVAAVLGGRGPGLTPSGDDVLAGLLLVAAAAGTAGLDALVERVATTEVARAFLVWAARGQSIASAHDWLAAVAAGDPSSAGRALVRLHSVGADSGVHLAAGLALGVGSLAGGPP